MENALIKLKENVEELSRTEKIVAEYILGNLDEIGSLSIHELAEKTDVSTSAIIRMARAIGYQGYKDVKKDLIAAIALDRQNKTFTGNEIEKDDSFEDIVHKITQMNIQSLLDTESIMSISQLKQAVALMKQADHILLYGLGASFIAAKDLYLKLVRINKTCLLNEDWHLQLVSAYNSKPSDVAIVFSYSGQTHECIACMNELRINQTPIIAITRCVDTPVSQLADINLYTTSNESLFRSAAMSSRISSLGIVDILYTCYATSTYAYTLKQLQKTHIKK
jgi:DNA-binding MurR/RpiR family transcriptional regulator